jgi:hypothetical protein
MITFRIVGLPDNHHEGAVTTTRTLRDIADTSPHDTLVVSRHVIPLPRWSNKPPQSRVCLKLCHCVNLPSASLRLESLANS